MDEFELIRRITQDLPTRSETVVGVGDDCAVLDLGDPARYALLKTDAVVEGVHFEPDTDPHRIGHKALARVLSDLAAMGGEPVAALVTLGMPPGTPSERLESIYAGIRGLAERFPTSIVGGDTVKNPERLWISVALLGRVPREQCLLRSGAQAGDAIFVSGELGGSLEGKHLDFEPRLREAQWLAGAFKIHAMIDISDGLAGDLRHLIHAGGVGAELLESAIPISPEARRLQGMESAKKTPLLAALTDGEDYELLFAVPRGEAVGVLDGWKARFPDVKLSCIGQITNEPGVRIRDRYGVRPLTEHGYLHFNES